MLKRLIGSGLLAGGVAVAMLVPSAAPAGAVNGGAAFAVITGTVDTSATPVQFGNLALAGDFTAVQTAPTASAASCAGQVATTGVVIDYSIESPAEGPLPAGILYNAGHFDPASGSFAGGDPTNLVCHVNGILGDGALYSATNPVLSGAGCAAASAVPNKAGNNACQGISFISLGSVALAELNVDYTVTEVGGLAASNSATPTVRGTGQETIAVVDAAPGACTGSPGNLNCALVVGAAVVA